MLTETPDYSWDAGCFGTASGNLAGYWDRQGFPDFYTGPTEAGVAPLFNNAENLGIRSLWASRAGLDGRPLDQPGHMDDYWVEYESTAPDPYITAGRNEHAPDCIGDFIGLSQNKWTDLNGECDGNIDAFSVVHWDPEGAKRIIPSLRRRAGKSRAGHSFRVRAWAKSRADRTSRWFSQLVDFQTRPCLRDKGFTFEDLMKEIVPDNPVAALPAKITIQLSRSLPGMARANPNIHGPARLRLHVSDSGQTICALQDKLGGAAVKTLCRKWNAAPWQADLPVRGVIGFHPLPRITNLSRESGGLDSRVGSPFFHSDDATLARETIELHSYVVGKGAVFLHLGTSSR